jgi:signal transduction histidine kinase
MCAPKRKATAREGSSMSVLEKVNILMVDDQVGKLLSYEAILADLGENLLKAQSGKEALELLLKNDVAVVLLDVSMPVLDGFELAEMIRQHPRFQRTPIIFISAVLLTDLDRLKGYQRGAVDYISVPVVPELLRAKVSVFVDLHRKTRQLELLNHELRRLSSSLIAAQDQERRRIARDLHDGLGQELSGAKMMVDCLQMKNQSAEWKQRAAAEASTLIDQAIQQVRSISHLLHPPMLDEVGLHSSLQWYLDGLTKRSGLETSLSLQPEDFPRLGSELETSIFRIVQEALTNVYRHAEARKTEISLAISDGQIVVTVRDDGKGIPNHISDFEPGMIGVGIAGMRQRVKELGGELRLRNGNPGTLVEAAIPIKSAAPPAEHLTASREFTR